MIVPSGGTGQGFDSPLSPIVATWPSGLRRQFKALVFGRGFESHRRHFFSVGWRRALAAPQRVSYGPWFDPGSALAEGR